MKQIDFLKNRRRYTWDEKGIGYLFADCFKDTTRYCHDRKCWMYYDGKVWLSDIGEMQVSKQAKELTEYMLKCAFTIEDEEIRKEFLKFVAKLHSVAKRGNIIKDAQSVYNISYSKFDTHLNYLNCQNGTLNLDTFQLMPHNPNDYLSMITNVNYDTSATCKRWDKFIMEIMKDDISMAAYLQRCLGYALTGHTWHECFFILIGNSARNGKGTTMETMRYMLGDYAASAQPETIAQKSITSGSGPSEDIARLKGARLVSMSEPEKGMRLDVAKVKQFTGGDSVTARYLHENSFEYLPEYKLYMSANSLPHVNDNSLFTSERVKLIPFDRHFEESERDTTLKEQFRQPEAISGIFNWCIYGLKELLEIGISMPDNAKQVLSDYQDDSDIFSQFMKDEYEPSVASEILTRDMYPVYERWCEKNGNKPLSSKKFVGELRTRYTVKRGVQSNVLCGFERISSYEDPLDADNVYPFQSKLG